MKPVRDTLLFLFANLAGFTGAPLAYNVAVLSGWFSPATIETDPAAFQASFFSGTTITWALCAIFSLGFFMIHSKMRMLFLLIPVLVPLAYGLSVLNEFAVSTS